MQKRIRISERPYWVGVYNDEPDHWIVVGEVCGETIQVSACSERQAIEEWRTKIEARLSTTLPVRAHSAGA